jgi:hypothetical protein
VELGFDWETPSAFISSTGLAFCTLYLSIVMLGLIVTLFDMDPFLIETYTSVLFAAAATPSWDILP